MKKSITLFVGDSFLIDDQVKQLIVSIQKEQKGELHQERFSLLEGALDPILIQARTLPFLASAQVLRIQNAEKLNAPDLKHFEKYAEKPSPQTYLILEASTAKKSDTLVKLIIKYGEVRFIESYEKAVRAGFGENLLPISSRHQSRRVQGGGYRYWDS